MQVPREQHLPGPLGEARRLAIGEFGDEVIVAQTQILEGGPEFRLLRLQQGRVRELR
jgi:hypothetical protein